LGVLVTRLWIRDNNVRTTLFCNYNNDSASERKKVKLEIC
jgi:hypothetical protein